MSLKIPRWFKILAAVAGGIAAVIFIGLFIYVKTLDYEEYADLIEKKIRSATGREFRTAKVGISVFPGIGLVADDVQFENASWGSRPEMVSIKRIEGRVAIVPLLMRRVEIGRLQVTGATFLIETNKEGVGNWVFGSQKPAPAAEKDDSAALFSFGGLDDVSFKDTVLLFSQSAGTERLRLDIQHLELAGGGLSREIHFKLDAAFRDQPFTASGSAGLISAIMKKSADWPLEIDFSTDGTGANIKSHLDWRSLPPPARGSIELNIDDSAGLEKLAGTSLGLPLPLALTASVKTADGQYLIELLKSTIGKSDISGSVGIKTGGKKPAVMANFKATSLDLSGRKPSRQNPAKSSGRVFSDAPFPLALLKTIDADLVVKIDRLILTNELPLDDLQVSASVQNGTLKVNPLTAAVGGGILSADLTLGAADNKPPSLVIKAEGKNISGEKLAAAMGYADSISGGSTDIAVNLAGPGKSLAHFMGGAGGEARLVMGPGVFRGKALDWGGDTLTKLSDLVNPFRRQEKQTTLVCGVVRLPVRDGMVTVDRSIAMETNRLTVVAAGQINLRNETLNLGFKSHVKEGIGIGAVNLADLVRVSGPLSNPSVGADTVESAKKALSVGGALVTGGLSLLGEALYKKTIADPDPCRTALSGAGSKSSTATIKNKNQKENGGIVDSIKNLFRK